ncbi:MAG: hypothetical protein C0392_08805 [Syntrophus sp. (in: bacteria)]|nr:hypothetical protein [Syntrophus sp. (in: bacteria)]
MRVATRQANFLLPEDLIEELRKSVPKREQSKVIAEALRKELKRLKLQKALGTSFGAWKDEDHPELQQGTETFVKSMRTSDRLDRINNSK